MTKSQKLIYQISKNLIAGSIDVTIWITAGYFYYKSFNNIPTLAKLVILFLASRVLIKITTVILNKINEHKSKL